MHASIAFKSFVDTKSLQTCSFHLNLLACINCPGITTNSSHPIISTFNRTSVSEDDGKNTSVSIQVQIRLLYIRLMCHDSFCINTTFNTSFVSNNFLHDFRVDTNIVTSLCIDVLFPDFACVQRLS